MYGLEIPLGAAQRSVTTRTFPFNEKWERAMHGGEENVMPREKSAECRQPAVVVEDVLENEVVPGVRIGFQGSMEAFEKRGPLVRPAKIAALEPARGKHARVAQMID